MVSTILLQSTLHDDWVCHPARNKAATTGISSMQLFCSCDLPSRGKVSNHHEGRGLNCIRDL